MRSLRKKVEKPQKVWVEGGHKAGMSRTTFLVRENFQNHTPRRVMVGVKKKIRAVLNNGASFSPLCMRDFCAFSV